MTIEEELEAFNTSFRAALADRDVESIVGHFEVDARLIVPGRPQVTGHDELRAFFAAGSVDGVRLASYAIDEILEGGPFVIELGNEVFSERRADGSTVEFPMSSVCVYRRGEDGRLRLLVDCVSPDN